MKSLNRLIAVALVFGQVTVAFADEQSDVKKSIQERLEAPEKISQLQTEIQELKARKKQVEEQEIDDQGFVRAVDEFRAPNNAWLTIKIKTYETLKDVKASPSQFLILDGSLILGVAGFATKSYKTAGFGLGMAIGSASYLIAPAFARKRLKAQAESIEYIEKTDAATTTERYFTLKNSTIPNLEKTLTQIDADIKTHQDEIKSLQ